MKLLNKLKSKKGESLAEVLVTVLITVLGLAMLLSLIMASSNLIDKGHKNMTAFYKGTADIEAKAVPIADSQRLTVSYKSDTVVKHIDIDLYTNDKSSILAYSKKD